MTLNLIKACFSCVCCFVLLATIILKDEIVCNLGTTLTSTPKHISSATKSSTLYSKGKSTLVFGKSFRAYIFSAIKHSAQTFSAFSGKKGQHIQTTSERIVITGWILKGNISLSDLQLFCCFYNVDGSISTVKADIRKTHFESKLSVFNALQCVCKVQSAVSPVIKVSIKESNSACPNTDTHYVHVDAIQQRQIDGIALCAKVLYDKLNASILIEWFEAQRWLGVDKIFCYINKDLNNDAKNVIKYYEESGLSKAASFEVPEIDTFPRHLADKKKISWTDAGVPLLDYQERMHEYKYAICLDHDEILIPENITLKDSLKRYLAEKFLSNKTLALMFFQTMVHVTSWDEINPNHPLFIGRLANSTLALWDRKKYAFRPEGCSPGSCSSHRCGVRSGYKSEFVEDNSAIIHHFRSCRGNNNWNNSRSPKPLDLFIEQSEGKMCSNFKRLRSYTTERLADQIKHNVRKVRSLLRLD